MIYQEKLNLKCIIYRSHLRGGIFPHWFYYLGGKRVPIWFAVMPATCASVLLIFAGLKISPIIISKILDGSINTGNWGELGPSLFSLPWGIALGLATISYCQRRRGQCKYCRRFYRYHFLKKELFFRDVEY